MIGAFVSAATSSRTIGPLPASGVLFGVVNLVVVASPGMVASMLLMGLPGFTNVAFNDVARGLAIMRADGNMQGRVMALHGMLARGGTPIGAPVMGVICAVGGVRTAFVVAAVTTIAAAVAVLPSTIRSNG